MFLKTFCVPIIPYMLENRIGLDESVFQTVTVWLIAEDAAITLLLSGPVGHYADHSKSKRAWLMWALVIASASTVGMAVATSGKCTLNPENSTFSSECRDSCCPICKQSRASKCQYCHVGCELLDYSGYHPDGEFGQGIRFGLNGVVCGHINGSNDFWNTVGSRRLLGCVVQCLCLSTFRYHS